MIANCSLSQFTTYLIPNAFTKQNRQKQKKELVTNATAAATETQKRVCLLPLQLVKGSEEELFYFFFQKKVYKTTNEKKEKNTQFQKNEIKKKAP